MNTPARIGIHRVVNTPINRIVEMSETEIVDIIRNKIDTIMNDTKNTIETSRITGSTQTIEIIKLIRMTVTIVRGTAIVATVIKLAMTKTTKAKVAIVMDRTITPIAIQRSVQTQTKQAR